MIDHWVSVSCDECGRAEEVLEDAGRARRAAKRNGWAVNLPPAPGSRQRRDLCPPCAKVYPGMAATAEEPDRG